MGAEISSDIKLQDFLLSLVLAGHDKTLFSEAKYVISL